MGYWKRMIGLLLALCVSVCAVPGMALEARAFEADYRWITNREEVDGGSYTANADLADKLNSIFDGNASVYKDPEFTKLVNTELGCSRVPNNGVYQYVGPYGDDQTDIGTSCWIYANGVYFTLFGEGTGNGETGEHSEKLDLKVTTNRNFTYDNFTAWGVRPEPGALIRTQCGHSLIVLDYDEEGITILDGNGNGKGLVAIREMKWNYQSFRAKYIIQPTQAHFDSLYPAANPEPPAVIALSS